MRVGLYQYRPLFGRVRRNRDKVISVLENCQADLIVLPELAFTGYFFKDRQEALSLAEEPQSSETVERLVDLCKAGNFHLVTGFTERQGDRCYNSSLLIGPGGLLHTYRKLHLFNEEKFCFDPGDTELSVQDIGSARIGMMVCFDWVFPEVTRSLALQGAQIICHPSNLVLNLCQKSMVTRCLENRVYAVTANRYGLDRRPHGQLRFTGRSQIVSPTGELLYRAPARGDALHVITLDPAASCDKSITTHNEVLSDRRPEYYRHLVR